jgi:hypothetical protein
MWAGTVYRRGWVVAYHPNYASHSGWDPARYAALVAEALGGAG